MRSLYSELESAILFIRCGGGDPSLLINPTNPDLKPLTSKLVVALQLPITVTIKALTAEQINNFISFGHFQIKIFSLFLHFIFTLTHLLFPAASYFCVFCSIQQSKH
jgi:hypothetical protein